jgi:hypothetical protein
MKIFKYSVKIISGVMGLLCVVLTAIFLHLILKDTLTEQSILEMNLIGGCLSLSIAVFLLLTVHGDTQSSCIKKIKSIWKLAMMDKKKYSTPLFVVFLGLLLMTFLMGTAILAFIYSVSILLDFGITIESVVVAMPYGFFSSLMLLVLFAYKLGLSKALTHYLGSVTDPK